MELLLHLQTRAVLGSDEEQELKPPPSLTDTNGHGYALTLALVGKKSLATYTMSSEIFALKLLHLSSARKVSKAAIKEARIRTDHGLDRGLTLSHTG